MVRSFVYHPSRHTEGWNTTLVGGEVGRISTERPWGHPKKAFQLIHPAPLLYSDVEHEEGPGWKLLEVAPVAQAEDGCVPQV